MHRHSGPGSVVSGREGRAPTWRSCRPGEAATFCSARWINKKHKLILSQCAVGRQQPTQLYCESLMPLDACSTAWALSQRWREGAGFHMFHLTGTRKKEEKKKQFVWPLRRKQPESWRCSPWRKQRRTFSLKCLITVYKCINVHFALRSEMFDYFEHLNIKQFGHSSQ